MRLKQLKHKIYVAVTALALGVAAFSGVDASAAKITKEPTQNYKTTVSVGTTISTGSVMNLKINGKSASKYKSKIKTIQTAYDPTYIRNDGTKTYYVDDEFVSDTEDYEQKTTQNYKYIAASNYSLTFLKAGTYTISYDKYTTGETTTTTSPDGKSYTKTYELIKTHYVKKYKVVTTTDPIKSFTLGKNKITYTYKSSGTKTNVKTVTKYRYLQGKSGKLSIKANSNYKITSAFAVTYNSDGTVKVSASGNNKKVTYGTGKSTSKTEVEKYIYDANGNYTYVKDAAGNDTDERQSQMVTTATSTSKYKPTTIYYGYMDKFTGSYTTYSVGTKQVYVRRKDEKKHVMYEKNPDGTYATDANGYRKYVVDTVTATVVTKKYPQRTIVDGAYKTVQVVEELVVLPGAKSMYESGSYYLDAACRGDSFSAGYFVEISKDGVSPFYTVTLEDGRVMKHDNPAYYRKFYNADYKGTWQEVAGNDYYDWSASDKSVDLKTDNETVTKKYKWVTQYDAKGEATEIKDLNNVDISPMNGHKTFNKK